MKKITLITTCTFGLEALLKREVQDLGFTGLTVFDGKIEFAASLADIPRLNINLRVADRVLLKLGEFKAADFDQLFDQTMALPFEDWMPKDAKITVVGKSVKSALMSVRTCQSMIKKAIVKRFQQKFNIEWLPESGAEYTVSFALFKDVAHITLDTTGPGLNKRGYRTGVGEAPIRENLAAALVLLSDWNGRRGALVDPMCGSGTILIEAAMIGRKIAPGLRRTFASQEWKAIDAAEWEKARREALQAQLPDVGADGRPPLLKIRGYDKDRTRIADCVANAKKAGVGKDILFEVKDVRDLDLPEEEGVVLTNPPYGINIGELRELPPLYEAINRALEHKMGWALFLLTADKSFTRHFKRARPDKVRKLINGTIEVHYFQYYASQKRR